VNLRQRIRFYQQLAVLTRAGVPMRTGLQRLQGRITGRDMTVLTEKISQGEMVGDAFAAAGFSTFECHLVAAGEKSAQLDTVFQHLAEFWSRQRQMFQAITQQLYYPLVIFALSLVVGAIIGMVMNSWSWPVAVIHLVETLAIYGAGAFVAYTLVRVSWRSDAAQRFWLALPLIGGTLSTAYAHRWITAVRLEHGAGVPMPDAVADAWRASGYAGSEARAEEGRLALREGAELSSLVQKWRELPREWVDFIETGEISGALETAFASLEEESARAWALAQKRMTDWMPKIVYFGALLIVGIQVLLLFLNVYQHFVGGPMDEAMKVLNGQ
jgi:type II secretory pathway component PulF